MRVAVRHTDADHPNAGWFAFVEGRILGFTDPITSKAWSADEVAEALLARAKEQFPEVEGYEHRIETLHAAGTDEDGNEVGEWRPAGESEAPQVAEGHVVEHELVVPQGQELSAEAK